MAARQELRDLMKALNLPVVDVNFDPQWWAMLPRPPFRVRHPALACEA